MHNFDYKKSLGQNFLKDDNIVNKIVESVNFKENNLIIEIGPGSGALTKKMLEKVDNAILYEIDTRLEKILAKQLGNYNNYDLKIGDFLKADVREDLKKYQYDHLYIVANLPYYVTTPIINKIIKDKIDVEEMVIMVQKEVADRFSAKPGSKEYGQITVFLNYFFEIEKIINVSKNSFVPKPKVDSSVIRMKKRKNTNTIEDIEIFDKLIKDSFKFKRKTIKNNLYGYDLEMVSNIINKYGFGISSRSECLPYYVFVEIANSIK